MKLYRPVGPAELELIAQSGYRRFPPRLSSQPIFYPVMSFEYAEQIARDWNSRDSTTRYKGYVTAFDVDDAYIAGFERPLVGGREHEELWVPASALEEFNRHLAGPIEVVAAYEHGRRLPDPPPDPVPPGRP